MITYRYDLLRGGVKLAELTGVIKHSIGFTRNDYKYFTFDHIGNDLDPVVSDGLMRGAEIQLFRQGNYEGATLDMIWAGEIVSVVRNLDKDRKKTLTITVEHWASVFLKKRFVTLSTTDQEENIAWGLINNTQTDTESAHYTLSQVNCGFTQGTLEITGNTRTVAYTNQEILTALQQLADATDISDPQTLRGFSVSPDISYHDYKVFRWFKPLGDDQNVIYTNPQVQTLAITDSILQLADKVVATGKANIQATAYGTDQDELNFYKKRQIYVPFTNISDTGLLQDAANQQEVVMGNPPFLYSFTLVDNDIYVGQYGIGDTIFLQYQDTDPMYNLNLQLIVFGIDLTYNNVTKVESVTLTVASVRPVSVEVNRFERLVKKIERADKRLINLEKQ